jgi:hypothetical protein
MATFFEILNNFFDLFWHAQSHQGRYGAILLASLFSAVIFMLLFKKFSDQDAIDREKRKITGNILEIRIYQDNLVLIFRRILTILKHNLFYIRYTIPPLAVIILPLLIITMQVNYRCGYKPLSSGEEFIITARLDNGSNPPNNPEAEIDSIRCETSKGILLETPILRIPSESGVFWRARVASEPEPGNEWVEIMEGDKKIRRILHIAPKGEVAFDPVIVRYSFSGSLLHNTGGFISSNSIMSEISCGYPRQQYSLFLMSMDAIVLYFVLTLIFALILKPFLKVKI